MNFFFFKIIIKDKDILPTISEEIKIYTFLDLIKKLQVKWHEVK